jgi:mycothiol synthase
VTGLVADHDGELGAYVAVSPTLEEGSWAMEFAIHPLHRDPASVRRVVAAGLGRAAEAGAEWVRVWAFLPNLIAALEEAGFHPERELRQLRVSLPVAEAPRFPTGVEVAAFRPGLDEPAWLIVNNAAFAGHPENGEWTLDVLEDREQQGWFDPEGFRMAWEGGTLVGFCWTKRHDTGVGEIYVIAVAPAHQGRRLGRALVLEGLRYLAVVDGLARAMLYVDAGNERAMRLYENLGFRLDHVDRSLVRRI